MKRINGKYHIFEIDDSSSRIFEEIFNKDLFVFAELEHEPSVGKTYITVWPGRESGIVQKWLRDNNYKFKKYVKDFNS